MPKHKTPILAGTGYALDPKDQQRISDFIDRVSVNNKPSAVVVIDPAKFSQVAKSMNTSGFDTNVGFTVAGRTYLNGSIFSPSSYSTIAHTLHTLPSSDIPELVLSHELAHMNDTKHSPQWQENHDINYSQDGQKIYEGWVANNKAISEENKKNADTNYVLQQRANVDNGIQPVSAPIATQLSDAPYSLARSQRP